MKKPPILHPFLFAVFPVLFLLANNLSLLSPGNVAKELALLIGSSLVFALLLWGLVRLVVRDAERAGILCSLGVLLFFSFGHVLMAFQDWTIAGTAIGTKQVLLASVVIFALGWYFVAKTRWDLNAFTRGLNFVAVSLIVIVLINVVVYQFKAMATGQGSSSVEEDGSSSAYSGTLGIVRTTPSAEGKGVTSEETSVQDREPQTAELCVS